MKYDVKYGVEYPIHNVIVSHNVIRQASVMYKSRSAEEEVECLIWSLPPEIFDYVLSYLPLESIYRLGGTCRAFYSLIHRRESYWKPLVLKNHGIWLRSPDTEYESDPKPRFPVLGFLHDPSLLGNKELYLILSDEFRRRRSLPPPSSIDYPWASLLLGSWFKKITTPPVVAVPLFALLGPGIESYKTKYLVHRLVNPPRESPFEAGRAVTGQESRGGFSSGVKMRFRRRNEFELMCLYTNTKKARENLASPYEGRLSKENRLFIEGSRLNPAVSDFLLPRLEALIYVVDSTEGSEVDAYGLLLRKELDLIMMGLYEELKEPPLPILILCCFDGGSSGYTPIVVAEKMNLTTTAEFPWGVFDVRLSDLSGLEKAMDWLFYHCNKRKRDKLFHSSMANNA